MPTVKNRQRLHRIRVCRIMPHCLCAFQIAAMSVSCPVFRLLSVRLSRFSPLATFLLAYPFPVRSSDAIPILFIQPGSAPLGFPRSVRRSMFIGAPCSLSRRVSLPAAFPLALAPLVSFGRRLNLVSGCPGRWLYCISSGCPCHIRF